MKPDQRAADGRIGSKPSRNPAQPLAQPLAVFLRGGHAPQPPRRAGHQGHEQGHVIEKKDHA